MAEENGNGKVTIAILGYRVDMLEKNQEKRFDALDAKLDKFLSIQNEQAKTIEGHNKQIATNCDEIKTLRSSSRNWDFITGIGAVIANILGIVGINK